MLRSDVVAFLRPAFISLLSACSRPAAPGAVLRVCCMELNSFPLPLEFGGGGLGRMFSALRALLEVLEFPASQTSAVLVGAGGFWSNRKYRDVSVPVLLPLRTADLVQTER